MSQPETNHNLQNYDDSKSYISRNREKIIIFLATSFFSIHTLTYILTFKLNFPFGDDGQASSFAYEYLATGSWDGLFGITAISDYASHLIYSVKLIALPNLIYNSFDVDILQFTTIIATYTSSIIATYTSSIILGVASFTPMGIGVVESSLAGLFALQGVDISLALTIVIFIRIFTRWIGVTLGFILLKMTGFSLQSEKTK